VAYNPRKFKFVVLFLTISVAHDTISRPRGQGDKASQNSGTKCTITDEGMVA